MDKRVNKVLIVEDSKVINKLLVYSVTSQLHLDVESASTLDEAKKILESNSGDFFIAILDLNLPDAPSGEIVDLVLKYNIPPIILTGSMSDDLHDEMMEKPIVDYVVKRNLNEIEYVIQYIDRIRKNKYRKMLIVDDSKSSRKLISSLLNRQNLNVFEAENGEIALRILDKYEDICLVVTDFNMPIMGGMELTTKIREKYSRSELAIIGISASGGGGITSIQFLKAGANDFIARPFMHEEFYCRLNQNIDVIENYKILNEIADHDYLTGLFNRSYLFKTGEKLLQNSLRKNFSINVAMIDIDYFKNVNDTHGHHIGDRVLKHVSDILSEQMRESDILARIGGEEFCLLSISLEKKYAPKLYERFRSAVANSPLSINDITVNVTVSIGYTMQLQNSLAEMIEAADNALYASKENGRNQVTCYFGKKQKFKTQKTEVA